MDIIQLYQKKRTKENMIIINILIIATASLKLKFIS